MHIHASLFHCSLFEELKRDFSRDGIFITTSSNVGMLALGLLKSDIIHFVFSPLCSYILWMFVFLGVLLRKKIIIHWIGTDVLLFQKRIILRHFLKILPILDNRNIIHLTVAPWLKNELKNLGINTDIVPLVSTINLNPEPLPSKFTVLAYLPTNRYEFYGGMIIERLAEEFPQIRFLILANDGKRKKKLSNVRFLGWIPYEMMCHIYRNTTVLIRMTYHDGLPKMVLEALAAGRYVVFSKKFPCCFYARNYTDVRKIIYSLYNKRNKLKVNKHASILIKKHYNITLMIGSLRKIYLFSKLE